MSQGKVGRCGPRGARGPVLLGWRRAGRLKREQAPGLLCSPACWAHFALGWGWVWVDMARGSEAGLSSTGHVQGTCCPLSGLGRAPEGQRGQGTPGTSHGT